MYTEKPFHQIRCLDDDMPIETWEMELHECNEIEYGYNGSGGCKDIYTRLRGALDKV